jgi:Mce-associated membrane protein
MSTAGTATGASHGAEGWFMACCRQWRYSSRAAPAMRSGYMARHRHRADTVEQDLTKARDHLTGNLKDSYGSLIHDVVIPGSRAKQISTAVNVAAAASVSASEKHAVVLVFVNQTITIGNSAPTNTASSVRMTLDKRDGKWLVSQFDPV